MKKSILITAERLWLAWWSGSGAKGEPYELFREISARYSEPHRRYHTLNHVIFCLRHFRELRGMSKCPHCVEAALWYHDIVYVPGRADNEKQSASLARDRLKRAGFGPAFEKAVTRLILATEHKPHRPAQGKITDIEIIKDLDLAILGMTRTEFDLYDKQIRAEYFGIPEEEFRKGRMSFLRSILLRRYIFQTDIFRAKYETAARENVAALAAEYERDQDSAGLPCRCR